MFSTNLDIEKVSALRARPLSSDRKMGGTIWRKLAKLVGNVLQILANIGKLSLVVFSFDKHGYLLCIEAILTKM